jgi:hypothetical protein
MREYTLICADSYDSFKMKKIKHVGEAFSSINNLYVHFCLLNLLRMI